MPAPAAASPPDPAPKAGARQDSTLRRLARVRIVASRIFLAAVAVSLLFIRSGWDYFSPAIGAVMLILGLILTSLATAGRLWCSLYIAGYKNARLVTEGPYSMTRNPLYFFSFLGAIGIGLATATLTIPAVLAVVFWIYYRAVIEQEEEYLSRKYGAEFAAYCAATPPFWPRFAQLKEPTTYPVNPIVFRRHLGSAIWFPPALGVILLLKYLQAMLPNFLTLY